MVSSVGGPDTGSGSGPRAHEDPARLTAWVKGRVQGVGFRWSTRARALELGLVGYARNLDDDRVEVLAEGPRAACEQLLAWLSGQDPTHGGPPGQVVGVVERWSAPQGSLTGFQER